MSPKELRKQVLFAERQALNTSAFKAREVIVKSIGEDFTTRNKYTERGTRVQRARRAGVGKQTARVGTIRPYLEDHVTGGTRTGKNAIPTNRIRRNPKRRITRSRWPGALRDRTFIASGPKGRSLFRRGRGRVQKNVLLWFLPRTQNVKKRWDFIGPVERSHRLVMPVEYRRELLRAFRTARVR